MKSCCVYKKELKYDFLLNEEPKIGSDKKYHIIYKIIFPNGKYYLGEHTTKNLNDGYCGSGSLLPIEFNKCNATEVKKIILSFHNTKKEMEIAEEKTIGDLYRTDKQCLNLIKGGSKGFNEHVIEKSIKSRIGKKRSKESIEKQRVSCTGKHHTEETKLKQSNWHKKFWNSEESIKKREALRAIAKNRIITEELKKKISESKKKYNSSDYGKNSVKYRYYQNEVNVSNEKEKIISLLEKSKNENLTSAESEFLSEFWGKCKKERQEKRKLARKKEKYIFTKEHKKHLSDSRLGKKASLETKEKMSKMRKGRGNSRYIPNKIDMLDLNGNTIKHFNDCIEAVEFIKENINPKANSSEIFIACRTNRIRYNYKWKMIN